MMLLALALALALAPLNLPGQGAPNTVRPEVLQKKGSFAGTEEELAAAAVIQDALRGLDA